MKSQSKKRAANGIRNDIASLEQKLGPIEYRSLVSLKRYENNPRKHPEKQLVKLAGSIRVFGFAMPMLVDEQDIIIAGEARLEAARRVGITEVPVIVAHQWSPAQVRSYRLADNRLAELGAWDREALAIELAAIIEFDEAPVEILGWETAEIDLVLEEDFGPADEPSADHADDQVEPPAKPVSRAGDLWLLGEHRLLCGSSLETANWSKLLDGKTAAMVFTDPPYNVPVSGHVCGLGKVSHAEFAMASGEMTKAEFTAFLSEFIAAMLPHCKDGAVLDLCMDWRHLGELLSAIEGNGLSLLNLCAWNKNNGGMGSLYRSKHELVFITKKGKAPHTNNVELGKHGRYRTNVWDYAGINTFGKDRMKDLADHPTVKPTALVADAIRDVTHPGEIVLDAFMGSGTTILACERTKRRGYGIEIEPGYVDVAIRRWETMTGERAVLLETGQGFAEVAALRADNPAENEIPAAQKTTSAA
ncbi:methyltransferase [Blastomonas marina]|uniref:Methyltransferase n=1 Tax=Blastomonas marina TaxID=1867408 RepID=A0ABQ1F424_9SPHN|nr:DNA methyltransferase [Blastomonas marina]GFZ98798.1 methyltransferase [Blastomonas marina]